MMIFGILWIALVEEFSERALDSGRFFELRPYG